MLAMQKSRAKRGRKLKSKFVSVTCQTEVNATYLQYNKIFCKCPKRDTAINRKQISKLIRKYFSDEITRKKCSILRYIRRQARTNVIKAKSKKSVIYVGTKKLKSKKAVRNLSGKSVIYIGTTYNTLETPQSNDLIDLTKVEPALRLTDKSKVRSQSNLFNCFPKTTTKYYKRPLCNSLSDSVLLLLKPTKSIDLKRKHCSEPSIEIRKKFRTTELRTETHICLKQLMNVTRHSTTCEIDTLAVSAVIPESMETEFVKVNDEVSKSISESIRMVVEEPNGDGHENVHTDITCTINDSCNDAVNAKESAVDRLTVDINENISETVEDISKIQEDGGIEGTLDLNSNLEDENVLQVLKR